MSETKDGGSNTPREAKKGTDPHHQADHQHVQVVASAFLRFELHMNSIRCKTGKVYDLLRPTFNLCSFLLTMTEVICWSMKRRTVRRRAGMLARR